MISLRGYQQEAVDVVFEDFNKRINSQLIVLPTGTGKTIVMAAIAKHFNKKTLLLAHREELIKQAEEKFKLYWPEADIGICKAEKNELDHQIVIGSVQSCCRAKRLEQLKAQNFDLLIVDEAHHSIAPTYQRIIDELGFKKDKSKLLIGVTATNKHGLGSIFKKVVFFRSISTMIRANYLVPVIGRRILTSASLKDVGTYKGDFAIGSLSNAINLQDRNKLIVEKYKSYADGRTGIAFCADVQHCFDLAQEFNNHGIFSEAVWGEMEVDQRSQALARLRSGETKIITSCGVMTEGIDIESINAILMCRPTKSSILYTQCLGRGLRLWPGKSDCLLLDFYDNGHDLQGVMSLSKIISNAKELGEEQDIETPKPELPRDVKVIQERDEEFDVLGAARFVWIPLGNDEYSLLDDNNIEIVIRPHEDQYVADLYWPSKPPTRLIQHPLPLTYCMGSCEDYARNNLAVNYADLSSVWTKNAYQEPPTVAQKAFLMKNNVYEIGMNKRQAALAIRKIISIQRKQLRDNHQSVSESITSKQKFFLEKNGINTQGMDKLSAMKKIEEIKKKGFNFFKW